MDASNAWVHGEPCGGTGARARSRRGRSKAAAVAGEARDRAVPAMGCCFSLFDYFKPPTPEEFLTPQPAAPSPLMTDVPRQLLMNRCDATLRAGKVTR